MNFDNESGTLRHRLSVYVAHGSKHTPIYRSRYRGEFQVLAENIVFTNILKTVLSNWTCFRIGLAGRGLWPQCMHAFMKKSGCFGVALFLALCVSMLANLVLFGLLAASGGSSGPRTFNTQTGLSFEEEVLVSGAESKVVVIPLEGIIAFSETGQSGASMVSEIKTALDQALNDPNVVSVVFSVDSPGGEITASDVLYHAIREFSEHKPVVVFINSVGASGAYYAACGANWIMSNPTSFTGSIGVIISTLNYEDLFGKVGLQSIVFKSGKFKDMLSGTRPISADEAAYVQGLVMQSYERFLGIVAESRELEPGTLREGAADGRILSGTDALEAGLIDQVGYIQDSYTKAMELAEVEDATVVRYQPTFNFANFFRIFGESQQPSVEVNLMPRGVRLEPGRLYLLPPLFAR
jgi:protease IV